MAESKMANFDKKQPISVTGLGTAGQNTSQQEALKQATLGQSGSGFHAQPKPASEKKKPELAELLEKVESDDTLQQKAKSALLQLPAMEHPHTLFSFLGIPILNSEIISLLMQGPDSLIKRTVAAALAQQAMKIQALQIMPLIVFVESLFKTEEQSSQPQALINFHQLGINKQAIIAANPHESAEAEVNDLIQRLDTLLPKLNRACAQYKLLQARLQQQQQHAKKTMQQQLAQRHLIQQQAFEQLQKDLGSETAAVLTNEAGLLLSKLPQRLIERAMLPMMLNEHVDDHAAGDIDDTNQQLDALLPNNFDVSLLVSPVSVADVLAKAVVAFINQPQRSAVTPAHSDIERHCRCYAGTVANAHESVVQHIQQHNADLYDLQNQVRDQVREIQGYASQVEAIRTRLNGYVGSHISPSTPRPRLGGFSGLDEE